MRSAAKHADDTHLVAVHLIKSGVIAADREQYGTGRPMIYVKWNDRSFNYIPILCKIQQQNRNLGTAYHSPLFTFAKIFSKFLKKFKKALFFCIFLLYNIRQISISYAPSPEAKRQYGFAPARATADTRRKGFTIHETKVHHHRCRHGAEHHQRCFAR